MKNLLASITLVCLFMSCQQQKIGFVDNAKLINDYQEKKDLEDKLQIKINAFSRR